MGDIILETAMPVHNSISVVVPIFNEQDSLAELYARLREVLAALERSYEIIFVDDGSTDGSIPMLHAIQSSDANIVIVELRRNFGKATALQAGFQIAQGDIIITLDGDLQDDPNEIPRFLEMLEEGFDLVSGWKKDRRDPITKTLPSRAWNFITALLTGIPLRDFNCGFKAYRRQVVEKLDLYGELHRYIPVLAHAKGFRVGEIPVRHHPRRHGESKYSFERFRRGAFDLLTVLFLSRFQRRPLHLFGLLGLVFTLVGLVIDSYLTVLWLMGERPIGDRPLLALGTLLITIGIQVLTFGLMAEMFTAVTYRRSNVMELIRQVNRPSITENSDSDG
jgi:glycosyltransferase involved in cell wall biosynthesis